MTLDQIKAEMREHELSSAKDKSFDWKWGFETAVHIYEQKLSQLEPSDAKLRRVREKIEWINHSYNDYGLKDEVLRIIDAELTNKETKVEKKKQKIEIEVDVPEGTEVSTTRIWREEHHKTEIHVFFRPIEPPLELETKFFSTGYSDLNHIIRQSENESGTKYGQLDYCWKMTQPEARDLAKILTYWADKGKLPERVVVRNN